MSIATLKRKSIAKDFKTHSGKGYARFSINKATCGAIRNDDADVFSDSYSQTGAAGGFSINGRYRNRGRVGQDMKMSRGLSKVKNVVASRQYGRVPVYKGGGGVRGTYNRTVSGRFGIECCKALDNKLVKPSVITTKGLIYYKTRWVKRATNKEMLRAIFNKAGVYIDDALYPPRYDMVQLICNNWVKNTGVGYLHTNTQEQYIQDVVRPRAQICNPNRYSDVPREGQPLTNKYNCKTCRSGNKPVAYHIGGKYYQYWAFSKQTKDVPSSSSYMYDIKYNRGLLQNNGWQSPWPPTKSDSSCMRDHNQIISDVVARANTERFACFSMEKLSERKSKVIDATSANYTV